MTDETIKALLEAAERVDAEGKSQTSTHYSTVAAFQDFHNKARAAIPAIRAMVEENERLHIALRCEQASGVCVQAEVLQGSKVHKGNCTTTNCAFVAAIANTKESGNE